MDRYYHRYFSEESSAAEPDDSRFYDAGRNVNSVESKSKKKEKLLKSCASSFWRDQAPKREHGTLTLESTDTMAS